jgi:beta-galactosidase
MKRYDFNQDWTCKSLKTGKTIPVTLPHDAMRTERRVNTSLGEGNIGWFEGGDYEYRKTFTPGPELAGKKLLLEFESVYHNAEVWINGKKAMYRPYGYTNFYVESDGFLKPDGENEIRVIAHNSDQPNSRWYSGTGIFRPVWIWAAEEKHIVINGVKIETLSARPAKIRVRVETSVPGDVELEILDGDTAVAKAIGKNEFVLDIPKAKLWNVDTPNLYTARATFGEDVVEETFGIRTLTWTPDKGVAINGQRVVIRGACIHHDNGLLGACTYPEAEERRIRILKEAGYNSVRSAHNPCSKYLLDVCDRLGMLMMDEYVDCWYMHKTQHDYASYVGEWWKQDMKDMVDKDFNHPSVIIYSTGNEVAETAQAKGISLQKDFTEYLHQLDPTRPVTCGINIFFNFLSSMGMGVYSDEKAQQQAEAAKKAAQDAKAKKPKKKHVGSEFYNVLAAKLGCDFMKFGASLPPCDWKTKDAFAAMDIAGYNYGNWRYRKDARKYPNRLILGSETLIGDAYDFWEVAKTTPQVVGDYVWAGWDYIGECGDGGPEFADYKTDAPEDRIRGGTCRIDVTGKKTPEVDYTRVAFELDKGPYLAVHPVYEKEKPAISGWQLTRAMRSWTYPGCDGQETDVEVYARAASVELFVNGKSVGKKKPKKARAIFRTAYHDGELSVTAYDKAGKEIGRDTLRTAGAETILRLEPEKTVCHPGEMVYFRMRYTDRNGEVKPMEKHRIAVSAENGTVMGTANGSCYFQGNYAQHEVPTYFAEAQTVVQAAAPGTMRVTVTDGSLTAAVEIICEVTN